MGVELSWISQCVIRENLLTTKGAKNTTIRHCEEPQRRGNLLGIINYILVIYPYGLHKARSILLRAKLVPRCARNDGVWLPLPPGEGWGEGDRHRLAIAT